MCKWYPLVRGAGLARHLWKGIVWVGEVVLVVVLCLYCEAELLYLVHKESLLLRIERVHLVVLEICCTSHSVTCSRNCIS